MVQYGRRLVILGRRGNLTLSPFSIFSLPLFPIGFSPCTLFLSTSLPLSSFNSISRKKKEKEKKIPNNILLSSLQVDGVEEYVPPFCCSHSNGQDKPDDVKQCQEDAKNGDVTSQFLNAKVGRET